MIHSALDGGALVDGTLGSNADLDGSGCGCGGGNAALGNGVALIAVVRLLAALWPSAALLLEGMMLTMVVCRGKMQS